MGLGRYPNEEDDIPEVRVEPATPIRAAKMTDRSGSRVGGESEPNAFPGPVRETVGTASYLMDLEPKLEGRRNIAVVSNDDSTSSAMTLVVSYKERNGEEVVPASEVTSSESTTRFERDHKAMIQFGAGEASHTVMLDVVEGQTINIPGSYAEAVIFDMTYEKFISSTVMTVYKTQASASAQAHPSLSQFTQKVFCPFQVALDLENPPTLPEWRKQLLKAACDRTIITVA
jgi:hypothetical protein